MMVVEFLYFGKVFDPLQFQMNEVEVDRLLIGAGVKFGVFTNIWVKNRESLLFDGDTSKTSDESSKYIEEDLKNDREILFDGHASTILDNFNVLGDNALTEKGDPLVKANATMKEEIFNEEEEEDDEMSAKEKSCPHCGEVKHRKSLNRHIRLVHLTTKLQCNQCGLKLNSKEKLKIHISKVHETADDMKQCSFCEKVFDGKGKTSFHETTMHRGEVANDFKCENCGKCYKTKANMHRHTRIFH